MHNEYYSFECITVDRSSYDNGIRPREECFGRKTFCNDGTGEKIDYHTRPSATIYADYLMYNNIICK